MHDLDLIPDRVDRLKRFVENFIERRPSIPGGCPLFNTATDADDGNPVLRAHLSSIVRDGIEQEEIRRSIDPNRLATLIISSLEGAMMIGRLEKNSEPLVAVRSYVDSYLEKEVRFHPRSGIPRRF